jgi:hypothetical protein
MSSARHRAAAPSEARAASPTTLDLTMAPAVGARAPPTPPLLNAGLMSTGLSSSPAPHAAPASAAGAEEAPSRLARMNVPAPLEVLAPEDEEEAEDSEGELKSPRKRGGGQGRDKVRREGQEDCRGAHA